MTTRSTILTKQFAKGILSLLFLCSSIVAFGVNRSWVGGTSSDWNTASNWSPSGVPSNGDVLTIGPISGGNNHPTVSSLTLNPWNAPFSITVTGNAVLTISNQISVGGAATITVQNGGTLNHTGTNLSLPYGQSTITVNNGTFSTNASATITGDLSVTNGGKLYFNNGVNISNSSATVGSSTAKVFVSGALTTSGSLICDSLWSSGTGNVAVNGTLDADYASIQNTGDITVGSSKQLSIDYGLIDISGFISTGSSSSVEFIDLAISTGSYIKHLGSTFTVGNSTINSGGYMTLKSFSQISGSITVNGDLTISSGAVFTLTNVKLKVNGNTTLSNSNSEFHSGNDSIIFNGRLTTNGNSFYGDSSKIVLNGNGTNQISGNFYTNDARIIFNPTSYTEISSGGRFYVNSGTILFNDSARVGNNGILYGGTGTVTFSKSLMVSSSGEIQTQNGTLNFQGNATFSNSGTLNTGNGTINIAGDVQVNSSGTINNGSGTLNVSGNATFSNNGTLNAGTGELNFGGNVTIDNSSGTINADSSDINIAGDLINSGSFNPGISTVTFNGDSSQQISENITFYNLEIQTQGQLTAGGSVTVLNGGTIGTNAEISITDTSDQFNVQGDLVDSSGTLAVATNKPFVTDVLVIDSVHIVIVLNEAVTQSSLTNSANSTWSGRTISSRVQSDTNKLTLTFSPKIVMSTEYTLVFQDIQNLRTPPGVMAPNHEKRFTWSLPAVPSGASTNLSFSNVTDSSMSVNWTSGTGAKRIVIVRQGSPVNLTPGNGTSYSANASFGNGTSYGTNNYVVYNGNGNSFNLSNLNAGATYYFAIYEYNGATSTIVYQSAAALTGSKTTNFVTPGTPASGLSISNVTDTSVSLNWTNGSGNRRLVIARESAPVNGLPLNATFYPANSVFGNGSMVSPGQYVVYKGTGSSVTVTGLSTNKNYNFAVIEFNGIDSFEQYLTLNVPKVNSHTLARLSIRVFLEGPFNGTSMNTGLNSNLPDSQVFRSAPWNYHGTESVSSIPNDSIVDWVLVELRQAPMPNQATDTSIVGRRAGFLLSNGNIVDLDGYSPLLINTNRSGRMFVVVHHRTHIPVQSSDSLGMSSNRLIFDFTTSMGGAYGNTNPLKEVAPGVYAMYCGRVATNTSNIIGNSDRTEAWNDRNTVGYHVADVNLDGVVDAADRSQIFNNQGVQSQVAQ